MCVCVYVSMCVCVYVYICVYIGTAMHWDLSTLSLSSSVLHTHAPIMTYPNHENGVHVCMIHQGHPSGSPVLATVSTGPYTYSYTCSYICSYTCSYILTHARTHAHTYSHMLIHTYACKHAGEAVDGRPANFQLRFFDIASGNSI